MKILKKLIVATILSTSAMFAQNMQMSPQMMFTEMESPFDYNQTIEKVTQSYKTNGWQVLSVKDTNEAFVKKGMPAVGKLTNIKVCSDKIANKLLKDDKNKYLVTLMPCGVGVYERGGKVIVAGMNIGFMKNMFTGEVKSLIEEVEKDNQKILSILVK